MAKSRKSAGLLLYRRRGDGIEVFLVHPGGPFWRGKDARAWSIPKGEPGEGEDPLEAAKREFTEETGFPIGGVFTPLAPRRQSGGKTVLAWAIEGDCDAERVRSNTFSMEWPPRSGKLAEFPEVDRAAWVPLEVARGKVHGGQEGFLDELLGLVEKK
jgi:predicted NUDIX family NTP pyrophosphohydrolase